MKQKKQHWGIAASVYPKEWALPLKVWMDRSEIYRYRKAQYDGFVFFLEFLCFSFALWHSRKGL